MTTYIERMEAEKVELDERKGKLQAFIGSTTWETLQPQDKALMAFQGILMERLSEVLYERISRAKENG